MNWKQAGDEVISQLEKAGYESYIVGGAVRDKWLDRIADDVDVSTRAKVKDIQSIFARTIEVGIQHGTVVVLIGRFPVQVSTFKGASIEEDLGQRDFTINALAETKNGKIIDPFQGMDDLKKQQIRTVTGTEKPFIDDPLRLLRALRFSLQLRFEIEPETQETMNTLSVLIKKSAKERIAAELEKISKCPLDGKQWRWLFNQAVFNQLPYLFNYERLRVSLQTQRKSVTFVDERTWWSFAVYSPNIEEVNKALRVYKRSNKLSKDVKEIQQKVTQFANKHWSLFDLYTLGCDRLSVALQLLSHLQDEIDVAAWTNRYLQLPIKQKQELNISGRDILNKYPGISGSNIGKLICKVEHAVVSSELRNDKDVILRWLERESFE
ncbi:CCA tRNA nucleotidyltransferase [Salipaludibacillus sp. HK11]|uniref:CCA tRNA nucleotidyltransferase n=1 Tax=Salipaludibacillus sp. HK11 TaxID=3394320 RepID=UPI0039FDD47F